MPSMHANETGHIWQRPCPRLVCVTGKAMLTFLPLITDTNTHMHTLALAGVLTASMIYVAEPAGRNVLQPQTVVLWTSNHVYR